MNNLTMEMRFPFWWLFPLVALAAVIDVEIDWGRRVERLPKLAPVVAPAPVVVSLLPVYAIAGGIASRTETVQRTLFNPTRRPAPTPDGGAASMRRGQFMLTGTTLVDGKYTAFLREVAGNRPRRVQAGETVGEMLVAEVRHDRVKLTLGGESEEILLRVATNPRPTAVPVAAAPVVSSDAPAPALSGQPPPGAPPDARTLAERHRAARAAAQSASGTADGQPVAGEIIGPVIPPPSLVPAQAARSAATAPASADPQ